MRTDQELFDMCDRLDEEKNNLLEYSSLNEEIVRGIFEKMIKLLYWASGVNSNFDPKSIMSIMEETKE